MDIDTHGKVVKEDKPLTREDVERLLHKVGNPKKLDLRGRNLQGADLSGLNLRGLT